MVNKFAQQKPKVLIGNNQLVITVNPFDNFFKFTLSRIIDDEIVRYNLNDYTELKMTVKGPKKDLNFNVFRESTDNDFENGVIVFKISESVNSELQRFAKKNFNLFYINGVDVFGNRQIIYSGFYKMWDSKLNIQKLEQEYNESNAFTSTTITQNNPNSQEQDIVNDSLNQSTNNQTTTNTSGVPTSQQLSNQNTDLSNFRPIYRASDFAISIGLAPPVNDKLDYKNLSTQERAQLETNFKNRNYWTSTSSSDTTFTNADLSKLFPGVNTSQAFDKNLFIDYVEAYFKGLDIFPNTTVLDNWFLTSVLKNDLTKYIKNKPFRTSEVIAGLFLPLTPEQRSYFNINNIPSFRNNQLPAERSVKDNVTAPPTQRPGDVQSTSTMNSVQVKGIIKQHVGNIAISGATVRVTSTDPSFASRTVTTASDGKFNLGDITNFNISNKNTSQIKFEITKQGFVASSNNTATEFDTFTWNQLNSELSSNPEGLRFNLKISTQNQSTTNTTNNTSGSSQNSQNSGESQTSFSGQRLIGIVRDNDSNNPLQGVQITITSMANIFQAKTVSSQSGGTFDFGPVDDFPSDCRFVVLKTGYIRKEFDLSQDEILDEIRTGGVRIKIISQD